MGTCFLTLGKVGDVLSVTPLLEHFSKLENQPTNLIVSEQYANVVADLDYINPVIWNGHWQNLASAVMWAKERFQKVIVPQTYGQTVAIEHRTPSFQYDQWLRAGGLNLWDQLPLTIPRRENARELVERYMGGRPTILFADQGESSVFEHAPRLASKLKTEFPDYQLLLLSAIRLERFTDFVSLYDSAKVLIVTETAHLHLAKATATPTFALVTDKPQRWHGSAWSKRHVLHIRYSQYLRRERELIESIRRVL